jgi:hypothetical protein
MHCQNCGLILPDGTPSCPECGMRFAKPRPASGLAPAVEGPAAAPEPAAVPRPPQDAPEPAPIRRRHIGLAVGITLGVLALLAAAAGTVFVMLPDLAATTTTTPPVSTRVTPSASAESTPAAIESTATPESVVTTFYATANAGDFAALAALVTSDAQATVEPGALRGWKSTTFTVARSTVGTATASVYGHESRRQLGSTTRGVKFTLLRVDGAWLIKAWQAVDDGIINGAVPSTGQGITGPDLTAGTARDVVSTLLQARQKGDAESIRLVTTAQFQAANADAWLDGVDNSQDFTAFSISSIKKTGSAYVVTVLESWNSGDRTATYTVVLQAGRVLVDSWTSK